MPHEMESDAVQRLASITLAALLAAAMMLAALLERPQQAARTGTL